jgi:hypothetical protein
MYYIFPTSLDGRMWLRGDPTRFATVKEVANMGRIKSVFAVAAVTVAVLAVSSLPAAAEGFGPAFFCDAQALTNCTDTSDPALAEDRFSCEGAPRDVLSCTNQVIGESAPYCVFMGEDTGEQGPTYRDAYLCGTAQDFSDRTGDQFWYYVEAAQQQVGYP